MGDRKSPENPGFFPFHMAGIHGLQNGGDPNDPYIHWDDPPRRRSNSEEGEVVHIFRIWEWTPREGSA